MEKEDDYTVSFCPSFSCYYTDDRIVETAERVRLEYSDDEFEFVNLSSVDCDFAFPIFNQILITNSSDETSSLQPATVTPQLLRDLFLRDEDEFEGISSDMYCLWTPEISSWRKSKSTATESSSTCSRRWRIKDLLKRSFSEGKQMLKFLNLNSSKRDEATKKKEKDKVSAMKEEEKRESYLPYRQKIVGFSRKKKNYYSFFISL